MPACVCVSATNGKSDRANNFWFATIKCGDVDSTHRIIRTTEIGFDEIRRLSVCDQTNASYTLRVITDRRIFFMRYDSPTHTHTCTHARTHAHNQTKLSHQIWIVIGVLWRMFGSRYHQNDKENAFSWLEIDKNPIDHGHWFFIETMIWLSKYN